MTASTKSDPGSQSHISVQGYEGVGAPEVVYSIHFSRDEIRAIRSAAREAGASTAEWIRQAATQQALVRTANS